MQKDLSTLSVEKLQQLKTELESKVSTYDTLQKSLKELLAAAYGTMCSRYFRWYDDRLARSITISGQLTVKTAEIAINDYLNKTCGEGDYIIAMDTDSVYLTLEKFVQGYEEFSGKKLEGDDLVNFLDQTADNAINPVIDEAYEKLAKDMNAFENKMVMKRETIASRGIWTGKKKYALSVNDNEGLRYSKPDIKVIGLEVVRTSTPKVCRDQIEKALDILLHEDANDKLIEHIQNYRKEFNKLPFEEISFPRGVNNVDQYHDPKNVYKKSTPIQVKAALLYNKYTGQEFRKIIGGDKIRFAYLKEPNPWGDKVMGIPDSGEKPSDWNLDKWIDYDLQFDRAFLRPLERLCDARDWSTKKIQTLDDFFAF